MTTATIDRTKARGIPSRDDLVPLIMSDRKTQTRRVNTLKNFRRSETPGYDWTFRDRRGLWNDYRHEEFIRERSPYGPPGSVLYVKEAVELRDDVWVYRADGIPVTGDHNDEWVVEEAARWFASWSHGKRTPYRSTRYMPKFMARTFLEVLDVRVQQVQEISEMDALAEGFDVATCGRVLRQAAGNAKQEFGRWLEDEKENPLMGDDSGYWCLDCVEAAAKRHKATIHGWNESFDCDSAPSCEECGVLLHHSLTRYGIETELDLTDEPETRIAYTPKSGGSALMLAEMCEGMGDFHGDEDEYAGRLAQIGFGTVWDLVHGEGAWGRNDWVWAYTFRRLS